MIFDSPLVRIPVCLIKFVISSLNTSLLACKIWNILYTDLKESMKVSRIPGLGTSVLKGCKILRNSLKGIGKWMTNLLCLKFFNTIWELVKTTCAFTITFWKGRASETSFLFYGKIPFQGKVFPRKSSVCHVSTLKDFPFIILIVQCVLRSSEIVCTKYRSHSRNFTGFKVSKEVGRLFSRSQL